jgi:hypothetical protein
MIKRKLNSGKVQQRAPTRGRKPSNRGRGRGGDSEARRNKHSSFSRTFLNYKTSLLSSLHVYIVLYTCKLDSQSSPGAISPSMML